MPSVRFCTSETVLVRANYQHQVGLAGDGDPDLLSAQVPALVIAHRAGRDVERIVTGIRLGQGKAQMRLA